MELIGVVPSWVEEKKITVNQDYVESVLRAGGTPVLFPVTDDREQISTLLARVDGLLLTGGQDVNPAEYGEQRMPCCGDLSACRDAMEIPLCREALTRRMPVLAICRGMQLLSCVLGGTLYQDLASQFGTQLSHPRFDMPGDPVHEVDVKPDTLLSSVVGAGTLRVNSRHHQGIKALGKNLRVNAIAPDGLIGGIELPDHPLSSVCNGTRNHSATVIRTIRGCLTLSSMHALITVSRSEEKNPSGSGKSPLPEYRVLPR